MAITYTNLPSLSNMTGQAAAQGLGGLLQDLAQKKAMELGRERTFEGLVGSGIPRDQARALSFLSEKERIPLTKALAQSGAFSQGQGLEGILSQGLGGQAIQTSGEEQVSQLSPIDQQIQNLLNPRKPSTAAEALGQRRLTPYEQARTLMDLEKQKNTEAYRNKKLDIENKKELHQYSKSFKESAQAAEKNIKGYSNIISAARDGKINAGNWRRILDKVGLDIPFNYDEELVNKEVARLAQNVQSSFGTGSRLTNYLEQTYQRSLPSLWNTPRGIMGISKLNMINDRIEKAKDDLRDEIIRESNYKLSPIEVDSEIAKRIKPLKDQLEEEGIRIMQEPNYALAPLKEEFPFKNTKDTWVDDTNQVAFKYDDNGKLIEVPYVWGV